MTVTDVHKDTDAHTMTITTELAATPERAWRLWADPRQLEKWWGPPTYPATFVDHDLTPGGRISYFMTGPEGNESHGWWVVLAVDEPNSLEIEDGFANEEGKPDPDMPIMSMKVTFEQPTARTTSMSITTHFASAAAMEKMISMGMQEGMTQALGQIDGLLEAVS